MPTQPQQNRKLKKVSLHRICKFRKGDKLQLMVGKKAGSSAIGELLSIDSVKRRVKIKGVNMIIKHVRRDPNDASKPSGRVEQEASVHVSNVALICPKCLKPTRVGWEFLDTLKESKKPGTHKLKVNKVRVCRKCHERIDD
jgi:large subunit ribosomal protein L24